MTTVCEDDITLLQWFELEVKNDGLDKVKSTSRRCNSLRYLQSCGFDLRRVAHRPYYVSQGSAIKIMKYPTRLLQYSTTSCSTWISTSYLMGEGHITNYTWTISIHVCKRGLLLYTIDSSADEALKQTVCYLNWLLVGTLMLTFNGEYTNLRVIVIQV